VPAALPPPELIAPAPNEVSFGRVAGRVARGTKSIRVSIGDRVLAEKAVGGRRFDFRVELPQRDVTLRVIAVDAQGRRSSTVVGPVFGLPSSARPRGPPRSGHEDAALAAAVRGLARGFPGICGIFVQDFRTGAGASWNARAEFPAASTLKVAIAIQVLVAHRGRPPPGSRVDRLLRRMLIPSFDKPANELLTWLGGSTSGGSAKVNATLRALGLWDTEMYGGYIVPSARRPIPLGANEQPSFIGKRTTAWDFARLLRYLHVAADGKGLLARRFRGSFIPADARFLLYLIAHAQPNWLGRYLPGVATAHKPGWIKRARHDGGVVYSPRATFVVVVMTWNGRGVGTASEVLAGRVARAAYDRFRK
jgi:hypothetical protein